MNWMSRTLAISLTATLAACDNMANQPKLNPYELPYGSQARWPATPPLHTIARDEPLRPPGPPPVTVALLERGQQRFNIYCAPCHGRFGDGNGMIVQRGFPHPPSYHIQRLRDAPVGHFFEVMTNGFGAMYSYAARVTPQDRWRIAAYIRVLQLSQDATIQDVPDSERQKLTQSSAAQPAGPAQ